MVELAQVTTASQLADQLQRITTALDYLDKGGRIVGMSISPGQQVPTAPGMMFNVVQVPTSTMEYPPQMVDGIKTQLTAHRDAIAAQLAELGVTGMDQRK